MFFSLYDTTGNIISILEIKKNFFFQRPDFWQDNYLNTFYKKFKLTTISHTKVKILIIFSETFLSTWIVDKIQVS